MPLRRFLVPYFVIIILAARSVCVVEVASRHKRRRRSRQSRITNEISFLMPHRFPIGFDPHGSGRLFLWRRETIMQRRNLVADGRLKTVRFDNRSVIDWWVWNGCRPSMHVRFHVL